MLASLLTQFHKISPEDDSKLMSNIQIAASRVLGTFSMAPTANSVGFTPTLVKLNSLYGSDPFFIETGKLLLIFKYPCVILVCII